jgi:rare lipoprotein A
MSYDSLREIVGTPAEVLLKTKEMLIEEGWDQPGAFGGERGGEQRLGYYCVYNAMVQQVQGTARATKLAIGLLCDAAGVRNSRELTAWNDARGRTKDDVLAALDRAIEAARGVAAVLLVVAGWLLITPAPAAACDRRCTGLASFYGSESGSRTASGQRFNRHAMTAAHRCMPFGTKLRVTYGDRSVVVTINDRGPFIRGRVLDLSEGAARAIGLAGRGVGRVGCEAVGGNP